MKKILVCILSLTMMLFLTACGSTEGTSSAAQKTATAEKNTPSSAKIDWGWKVKECRKIPTVPRRM